MLLNVLRGAETDFLKKILCGPSVVGARNRKALPARSSPSPNGQARARMVKPEPEWSSSG